MRASTFLAVVGYAVLMAGCGIKGPLFVPEIPERPAAASPSSAPDHSKQPVNN